MDTCTIDGISFSYFFKAAPAVEWHKEPQHHTLVIEGHNVDGVPFDAFIASLDDEDEAAGWQEIYDSLENTILERGW